MSWLLFAAKLCYICKLKYVCWSHNYRTYAFIHGNKQVWLIQIMNGLLWMMNIQNQSISAEVCL